MGLERARSQTYSEISSLQNKMGVVGMGERSAIQSIIDSKKSAIAMYDRQIRYQKGQETYTEMKTRTAVIESKIRGCESGEIISSLPTIPHEIIIAIEKSYFIKKSHATTDLSPFQPQPDVYISNTMPREFLGAITFWESEYYFETKTADEWRKIIDKKDRGFDAINYAVDGLTFDNNILPLPPYVSLPLGVVGLLTPDTTKRYAYVYEMTYGRTTEEVTLCVELKLTKRQENLLNGHKSEVNKKTYKLY